MIKKQSGIYTITNTKNRKAYVGSSCDYKKRKEGHINSLRNNKHSNKHLQRAWNKYGEENFVFNFELSVFENCLLIVEQIYLNSGLYKYNIAKNARAPMRGIKFSKEHKRKIFESRKGYKWSLETRQKMKDRKVTDETKKKSSESHMGYKWTKEAILKRETTRKRNGYKISDVTKKKMSLAHIGHKMPEHVKEGLRKINTGRKMSEESFRKRSITGKKNGRKSRGKCYSFEIGIQKWRVRIRTVTYGYFFTEQEAKDKVSFLRTNNMV